MASQVLRTYSCTRDVRDEREFWLPLGVHPTGKGQRREGPSTGSGSLRTTGRYPGKPVVSRDVWDVPEGLRRLCRYSVVGVKIGLNSRCSWTSFILVDEDLPFRTRVPTLRRKGAFKVYTFSVFQSGKVVVYEAKILVLYGPLSPTSRSRMNK